MTNPSLVGTENQHGWGVRCAGVRRERGHRFRTLLVGKLLAVQPTMMWEPHAATWAGLLRSDGWAG